MSKETSLPDFRPAAHFTPPTAWMNDPNGLVYFNDEYHLFYQHHPDSTVWGPMHWGHAVSKDGFKWTHLPIALYPDELGTIFSGCAVAADMTDPEHVAPDGSTLVAFFTQHNTEQWEADSQVAQTQGAAFSDDAGRTWRMHAANPVIANPGIRHFRDPHAFFHAASGQWVLLLAAFDRVLFFTSRNLTHWERSGEFTAPEAPAEGVWECPALFPLPFAGHDVWVLVLGVDRGAPQGGSGTMYFVGSFDGVAFRAAEGAHAPRWVDHGFDYYAMAVWRGTARPHAEGIGWMLNWLYAEKVPTGAWRGVMSVPREFRLLAGAHGEPVLAAQPFRALAAARTPLARTGAAGPGAARAACDFTSARGCVEVVLAAALPAAARLDVALSNDKGEVAAIRVDVAAATLTFDRTASGLVDFSDSFGLKAEAPFSPCTPRPDFRIIVDRMSVELFADEGRFQMTNVVFPTKPYTRVSIAVFGGAVVEECQVWDIKI